MSSIRYEAPAQGGINLNVDGCILHPKRRRLKHFTGVYLRNLSTNFNDNSQSRRKSSATTPTTPTKHRRNTKERIVGFETPLERQLHLQKLNNEKFLNVFYSLHYLNGKDDEQCFYVSELRERSLNVDFQEFSLSPLKSSKDQSFTLKVWATNYKDPETWRLLINVNINLANLLYINKSMDLIDIDTKNSIFISLIDGIYLLPSEEFNLKEYLELASASSIAALSNHNRLVISSFTYDLAMKLNNLQLVVDDLTKVKRRLSKQIEAQLEDSQSIETFRVDQLREKIRRQKEINGKKKQELQELLAKKKTRLTELEKKKSQRSTVTEDFERIKEEFSTLLVRHETTLQDLVVERANVTKVVAKIFPKEQICEWLEINSFELLPEQISQNHLTKLVNSNEKELIDEMNAGFGYICHMVYLLSHYLAVPLKYQVHPFGSTSYVIDKISKINQRTIFPLFNTSHYYRFQYGVMLLNKNIQDISKEVYNY